MRYSFTCYACMLAILTACSDSGASRDPGGVVALVNDRPVTAQQLDRAMEAPGAAAPATRSEAVESLINEELLVQGSEQQHLDAEPAVRQELESSRRKILAHAFAERNLYPKQAIAPEEIRQFYNDMPILFEDRKRFLLKRFLVDATHLDHRLNAELDQVGSETGLRQILDRHGIKYAEQTDSIGADQLPLDKLTAFERAAVGDVIIAHRDDGNALLLLVTGIENDDAISFERATPLIEAYMNNVRNRRAVIEYLNHLKAQGGVTYTGDATGEDRRSATTLEREFSAAAATDGLRE